MKSNSNTYNTAVQATYTRRQPRNSLIQVAKLQSKASRRSGLYSIRPPLEESAFPNTKPKLLRHYSFVIFSRTCALCLRFEKRSSFIANAAASKERMGQRLSTGERTARTHISSYNVICICITRGSAACCSILCSAPSSFIIRPSRYRRAKLWQTVQALLPEVERMLWANQHHILVSSLVRSNIRSLSYMVVIHGEQMLW
jgi:hypothetical protein